MTGLRILIRAHRFEFGAVVAYGAAAFSIAAIVLGRLALFGAPVSCLRGEVTAECVTRAIDVAQYRLFASDWTTVAIGGLALIPVVAGLVLGTALTAKELDRGTAVFAWSIAPSRRRWFMARVVPVAIALIVVGSIAGLALDLLEGARNPLYEPSRSWDLLGLRGVVIPAQAAAIFGLSLAAGIAIGRILPALLISVLLIGGVMAVTILASGAALARETIVVVPDGQGRLPGNGDWRVVEFKVLGPGGHLLDPEEAYGLYGDPSDPASPAGSGKVKLQTVLLANPPEIYPLSALRIAIAYLAVGAASITVAFINLERRRP